MNGTTGGEKLLTVTEAAELVGRARGSVAGWVYYGHLLPAKREPRPHGAPVILLRAADVLAVAARMARRGKRVRAALATVAPPVLASQLQLPAEPTATRPGSEERVRVYEARVERREALFHPQDVTLENMGDGQPFLRFRGSGVSAVARAAFVRDDLSSHTEVGG